MSEGDVLAVDVGATSIRMERFNRDGEPLDRRSRRPTPYPCGPERLVALVVDRIAKFPVGRLALGFPGEMDNGVVVNGANLTRPGGLLSDFDPDLAAQWRGFPLQLVLADATKCHVRVENDATMAAFGCVKGEGIELVVTLGTGCGLALCEDGDFVKVRDVGGDLLRGSATYDDILGELGRRRSESEWVIHVVTAVTTLAAEFSATTIHLAGGNSRRLSPGAFGSWASSLVIERDDPALRGAWRASYAG